MRILVLGASGLLGSNLFNDLLTSHDVYGTYFSRPVQGLLPGSLNLEETSAICKENNIEVIVNCVGMTSIELCEKLPEAAWQINTHFVFKLGTLCKNLGIKLVHISTDHFDSLFEEPRNEDCKMVAVNQYGFTKLAAERICLNSFPQSIILRVNFIAKNRFGLKDNSLLTFVIDQLGTNKKLVGFQDVYFSPVSARFLSKVIDILISKNANGLFHVASNSSVSKFEFAQSVARYINIDANLVSTGSIQDFPQLTRRPSNLSLDASKLASAIELPTIEQSLKEVLDLVE